jgi:hypothetical protein
MNSCPPVNIPGAPGQSAFTLTTASITIPAANNTVVASVQSSIWAANGVIVVVSDGTNLGTFMVVGNSANITQLTLRWLNALGDSATGTLIANGAIVTPVGSPGAAGQNSYTTLRAGVAAPGVGGIGNTYSIQVVNSLWMAVGQTIVIAGPLTYTVAAAPTNQLLCSLTYIGSSNDILVGTALTGSVVSPGGPPVSTGGLATSGANSNITGLSGLTTPLSIAQGGTGTSTPYPALTPTPTVSLKPVQSGTAQLVNGIATVNTATIYKDASNVTTSVVVVSLLVPGGTRTAFAGYQVATIVQGSPGSFTITAINAAGATLAACTDTVAWQIIG